MQCRDRKTKISYKHMAYLDIKPQRQCNALNQGSADIPRCGNFLVLISSNILDLFTAIYEVLSIYF